MSEWICRYSKVETRAQHACSRKKKNTQKLQLSCLFCCLQVKQNVTWKQLSFFFCCLKIEIWSENRPRQRSQYWGDTTGSRRSQGRCHSTSLACYSGASESTTSSATMGMLSTTKLTMTWTLLLLTAGPPKTIISKNDSQSNTGHSNNIFCYKQQATQELQLHIYGIEACW